MSRFQLLVYFGPIYRNIRRLEPIGRDSSITRQVGSGTSFLRSARPFLRTAYGSYSTISHPFSAANFLSTKTAKILLLAVRNPSFADRNQFNQQTLIKGSLLDGFGHLHSVFTHSFSLSTRTPSSLESLETRGEEKESESSRFGGETSVSFTDAKISTTRFLLQFLCIMLFFLSLFSLLSCVMSE